jgi:hypothetical protein
MHKTDEAMAVVESKVFDYPLLAGEQIQSAVEDRLAAIAKNLDMPAESLPECSAEERFALTTDAYSKCRTQCRVRNSCAQYAAVRAEGSRKFAAARTTLASL